MSNKILKTKQELSEGTVLFNQSTKSTGYIIRIKDCTNDIREGELSYPFQHTKVRMLNGLEEIPVIVKDRLYIREKKLKSFHIYQKEKLLKILEF